MTNHMSTKFQKLSVNNGDSHNLNVTPSFTDVLFFFVPVF